MGLCARLFGFTDFFWVGLCAGWGYTRIFTVASALTGSYPETPDAVDFGDFC